MSSSSKNLTRRSLLSIAGGAAGLLATRTAGAKALPSGKDVKGRGPVPPSAEENPLRPHETFERTPGSVGNEGPPPGTPVANAAEVDGPVRPHEPLVDENPDRNVPKGPPKRELKVPAAGPEVLAMFGDVRPGASVGRWKVVAVHNVHLGAVPVVMQAADGTKFQLDVFRRDAASGAPAGVANTAHYSVFLSNGGSGATRSAESQGLAARALAAALEKSGGRAPASLLTMRQRHLQFPGGGYAVPV